MTIDAHTFYQEERTLNLDEGNNQLGATRCIQSGTEGGYPHPYG